jgi:hypothetical protein
MSERDIFNDAERNLKHAEYTMKSFLALVSPPFIWIFNKICEVFENLFENQDEQTKFQLKKLPF